MIWHLRGGDTALDFLTGYLIEYSLSVDNIFVFVLLFGYFAVPAEYQHRVLFWGIISALIMRGAMIGLGVQLIERFHWVLYIFGAFLVITGVKMFFSRKEAADPGNNFLLRLMRRHLPVTDDYHGSKFLARIDGKRVLTPLALVLMMVELTDLLFAVDSIPAVFGVTRDPFIVYTSNVCAMLGLRSLYFLLADVVDKFVYLKQGLAIILAFIGTKMLLAELAPIPTFVSLGVVALILAGSIILSLTFGRGAAPPPVGHPQ